ncbi:MAG: type 2 isopentenyl-diphosphate Delta-isomerase [Legionellales bacterium RIFCSPHIGHO2_12_FULL_37_14]|nr:MAG: type 2 isopentenyl-diphosphate Delta-isomerase [Legionellales bacterium RIFCSPHIGHO2_12_FULL_37_14]
MSPADPTFVKRKKDHLTLALKPEHQAVEMNDFDKVRLMHEALPSGNFTEVDISSSRFGSLCPSPFFVSSMTAGHDNAYKLNDVLMQACVETSWSMGVGSQRRELDDPSSVDRWPLLRKKYPKLQLLSNLGVTQVIHTPIQKLQKLVDAIEASALIIHCNALQECIQPEGTPQFKGALAAIESCVNNLALPIVVKETGCGFSAATMRRLDSIGVTAIDVSGLGGTHWGRIEGGRTTKETLAHTAAIIFKNWGLTTLESLIFAKEANLACEVWASGGIRNGLDAAKAIAFGATSVGFAKLMLEAAVLGVDIVIQKMREIEHNLRIAMFCTGSFNLGSLKEVACL